MQNNKTLIWKQRTIMYTTTSSKALLRGEQVRSCYEPGKYVRVTVGVKNETIKSEN